MSESYYQGTKEYDIQELEVRILKYKPYSMFLSNYKIIHDNYNFLEDSHYSVENFLNSTLFKNHMDDLIQELSGNDPKFNWRCDFDKFRAPDDKAVFITIKF